jgi:hypothetical protein
VATRGATQSTNAERAKALVMQRQAMLEPVEPTVRNELPVFGGSLITVTFKSNKEQRFMDNLVFYDGKVDHFFYNPSEFARYIEYERWLRGPLR